MSVQPKEFIYVDEIELNSILAQLDNGLPTVIKDVQEALSGNTEITSSEIGKNGKLDVVVAKAGTNKKDKSESHSIEQQMSQQAIETVYSDYAVNIIKKRLDEERQLKVTSKQAVGAYVLLQSKFEILNFSRMNRLMNNSALADMLTEQEGLDHEELDSQIEGLRQISKLTDLYSTITKGVDLISINNALVYAESKNFRMNASQRQVLSNGNRKITILGIIESVVSEEDMDVDFQVDDNTGLSFLSDLESGINMYLIHLLGDKILKKDDRLVKPIAIYFE
ncbi:DUF6414 family protein [Levilactobacillus brevis]|uniref:DUF6414 family protein n=1 Tax=Levilactobacillus brevis TaxID=1580 RepID=UPI00111AAE40|nr:hypothetical protein [Levilactobacillus brevis]QCZ50972.1 hypothetical protein SAC12_1399 [Levilactobacillus brevis]QCZ51008.1 hypothetical protein SAC12_1435 [Levilactobacillus brevis]